MNVYAKYTIKFFNSRNKTCKSNFVVFNHNKKKARFYILKYRKAVYQVQVG